MALKTRRSASTRSGHGRHGIPFHEEATSNFFPGSIEEVCRAYISSGAVGQDNFGMESLDKSD